MDIKDFILIGGGFLIAMVLGHGFWIAWRAKREPLRLDIVPDLIPDDVDEMERLRGELPNGGARVINSRTEPAQTTLPLGLPDDDELTAPLLMDPAKPQHSRDDRGGSTTEPRVGSAAAKVRPKVHQAPPRTRAEPDLSELHNSAVSMDETPQASDPQPGEQAGRAAETVVTPERVSLDMMPVDDQQQQRAKVREVQLTTGPAKNEPITADVRTEKRSSTRDGRRQTSAPETIPEARPEASAVKELLVINILAQKGTRFDGEGLVNALRGQGLRYGDMNIFHRVEPTTKAKLYSVANAIEPGTFDLSDLDAMRSPGISFFMSLPGPDDATEAFTDMLQAARAVALAVGGELRDEDLSVLTGQTVEHMRQRIADFARRRLSKRA